MGSRWLWTIVAGALAAAPLAAQSPDDSAAAAQWIAAYGHRLAAAEPSPAELDVLVKRLSGATVVGIGEVTHGTHEDQSFKAALIKALVSAGAVEVVALEANRGAGRGFDRYIRLGEGDPAALVRSRSFFRIWKGDEFAGLLLWLRAWNLVHPQQMVRIIGIDNQDAGVDADFALTMLARHDAPLAARLRPAFGTLIAGADGKWINPSAWIQASRPGEHPAAMAAAATLRDTLVANRAGWSGDPDYEEAVHAAKIAWQNLHQYELEIGQVDLNTLPLDYLARRDRYMAENLVTLLRSGERAAFWAHNMHVAHDLPAVYVKGGYTSIGIETRKRLGSAYRTVGFTNSQATVLAMRIDESNPADLSRLPADEPIAISNVRTGELGATFARLPGDAWWIDLDADIPRPPAVTRWLGTPQWDGGAGATIDPGRYQIAAPLNQPGLPGQGFDILVWFRTMTPQHRWPTAPVSAAP